MEPEAMGGAPLKRSRWRVTVGLAAVVVITLLGLNVSGLAPIPIGPLGDHQPAVPDPGGASTLTYSPQNNGTYLAALVENTGPLPATVVRVTPTGVSVLGSVEVIGSLTFNEDDPAERLPDLTDRIVLGVQQDPGPGWASPQPVAGVTVDPRGAARHLGRAFLVRITPDPTQETTVLRFDVEYTVGPLHFLTTAWGAVGTTVVICPRDRPVADQNGCVAG
jgi:hypothetical protein